MIEISTKLIDQLAGNNGKVKKDCCLKYLIKVSNKLIDQLTFDNEKVKRKVRKPKPRMVMEQRD